MSQELKEFFRSFSNDAIQDLAVVQASIELEGIGKYPENDELSDSESDDDF